MIPFFLNTSESLLSKTFEYLLVVLVVVLVVVLGPRRPLRRCPLRRPRRRPRRRRGAGPLNIFRVL